MKRLKAVIVKEFAHILRDPTSLTIIFLMPLLMMFIFGYSINYDLEKIETGIIDRSNGEMSRELVQSFSNNRYFQVMNLASRFPGSDPIKEGERLLNAGKLKQVIIIPQDFTRLVKAAAPPK